MHLAPLDPRTEFQARVLRVLPFSANGAAAAEVPGRSASSRALKVWLDASYFYAEGGGQPGDRGSIAGFSVSNTVEEAPPAAPEPVLPAASEAAKAPAPGDSVCHIIAPASEEEFTTAKSALDGLAASGEPAQCSVDPKWRLENSRQHTAQHVLSRAAELLFGSASGGFTIGDPLSVIEFEKKLSADQIAALEAETNRALVACMPVTTTLLPDRAALEEGAARYRLQDTAKYTSFPVRIVSIGDYDACPCCGTHLPNTGAAGMLKIFSHETSRGGTRVHFAAGERCLGVVQEKLGALSALARALTVAQDQVCRAVEGLQGETRAARRRERELTRLAIELLAGGALPARGGPGPQAGQGRCEVTEAEGVLVVSLVGVLDVSTADALAFCTELAKARGRGREPVGGRARGEPASPVGEESNPGPGGAREEVLVVVFQNLDGEFCCVARGPREGLESVAGALRDRYGCTGGGRGALSLKFPGKLKKKEISGLAAVLAAALAGAMAAGLGNAGAPGGADGPAGASAAGK